MFFNEVTSTLQVLACLLFSVHKTPLQSRSLNWNPMPHETEHLKTSLELNHGVVTHASHSPQLSSMHFCPMHTVICVNSPSHPPSFEQVRVRVFCPVPQEAEQAPHSSQSLHWGHSSSLQAFDSAKIRLQLDPDRQSLRRVVFPPPHVREHWDHSDQSEKRTTFKLLPKT